MDPSWEYYHFCWNKFHCHLQDFLVDPLETRVGNRYPPLDGFYVDCKMSTAFTLKIPSGSLLDIDHVDGQPTPPGHVPPPPTKIAGLMIRAYENHWFPLIRPAIKPLFLGLFHGYFSVQECIMFFQETKTCIWKTPTHANIFFAHHA